MTKSGSLAKTSPRLREQKATVPSVTRLDEYPPADTPATLNLPLDIYYASSEVDARAEPLNEVNLVYPLLPYQQRIYGVVWLTLFVNELGGIDKILVTDSSPAGVFDDAALQAVTELKFSPAIKDGISVKNRKTIKVVFDPYENINVP